MNPGDTLGPYRLERPLKTGGMGEVWLARHTRMNRWEAIKFLGQHISADNDAARRFLREVELVAGMSHPHIVTIHAVGGQDETWPTPYYAMEYLTGGTIADRIEKHGRLTLAQTLDLLEPIAEALDYAHTRGIIHRDIKPLNLMLTGDGRVKVVDFGVAKAMDGTVFSINGSVLGTPEYMAPEQAFSEPHGTIGPATDQYSLAVTAYQMLTGVLPFTTTTENRLSVLFAHSQNPPPDPRQHVPDITESVAETLLKALAKRTTERFENCRTFCLQLRIAGVSTGMTTGDSSLQGRKGLTPPTTYVSLPDEPAQKAPATEDRFPAPADTTVATNGVQMDTALSEELHTIPGETIVAADGSGDFHDIHDALQSAPLGATIRVRAGTYTSFRITRSVRIHADAEAVVEGVAPYPAVCIEPDSAKDAIEIVGLTVRCKKGGPHAAAPYPHALQATRGDIRLLDNDFYSETGDAVFLGGIQGDVRSQVYPLSFSGRVHLERCKLAAPRGRAITLFALGDIVPAPSLIVESCQADGCRNGVVIPMYGDAALRNVTLMKNASCAVVAGRSPIRIRGGSLRSGLVGVLDRFGVVEMSGTDLRENTRGDLLIEEVAQGATLPEESAWYRGLFSKIIWPDGAGDFSLNGAVGASGTGGVVFVRPGRYPGLCIERGVTLVADRGVEIYSEEGPAIVVEVPAPTANASGDSVSRPPTVALHGFRITAPTQGHGLKTPIRVFGVRIAEKSKPVSAGWWDGVSIRGSYPGLAVVLADCDIRSTQGLALETRATFAGTLVLRRCRFSSVHDAGLTLHIPDRILQPAVRPLLRDANGPETLTTADGELRLWEKDAPAVLLDACEVEGCRLSGIQVSGAGRLVLKEVRAAKCGLAGLTVFRDAAAHVLVLGGQIIGNGIGIESETVTVETFGVALVGNRTAKKGHVRENPV